MACSCKKKQQVQTIKATVEESTYQFDTTVKPLESCYVCASKHISLALTLIKKQTVQDMLVAIGQLQAATYHYNLNKTKIADRLKNIIQKIISSKLLIDDATLQQLQQCTIQSMQYQLPAETTQAIPSTAEYNPKEALKHACLAYSLLFTQLFYQQINKPYAIGQLILAALHLQAQDRDRAKKLRQIWKVVQQIKQPNDQDYVKSRDMLMSFMKDLQQALIIIV